MLHENLLRFALLLPTFICLTSASESKVKMDVYYETLCPDSIRFIKKLYTKYSQISDMIELNLVPFGKASWEKNSDSYQFNCQHGHKECLGNTIHVCALANLNFTQAFEFIHETESTLSKVRRPNVLDLMSKVGENKKLNFDTIKECAQSKRGQELLLEAGRKTKAVHPLISFIPTVVFNNQFSQEYQNRALYKDLVGLVKQIHDQTSI